MWHLSVSVWSRRNEPVSAPDLAEKEAIRWLRGVGNDREWWIWNEEANVGHLRVGVIDDEHDAMPCGIAQHDAGDTGPERPRTVR